MADDMRAPYWKSLASASSSRLSSLKDYVSQRDLKRALPVRRELRPGELGYTDGTTKKQSWTQWAGQKLAKRTAGDDTGNMEKVNLFPGWASRRYHNELASTEDLEGAPYDIEIFVSGYAVKTRAPGSLTRSQRTFLRLAKTFASLPKLPDPYDASDSPPNEPVPLSKSTEDLLATMELPPRPEEINEESELRALLHSRNSSATTLVSTSTSTSSPTPSVNSPSFATGSPRFGLQSELHRLHLNLESRLNPFWAAALPSRTVRVFLHPITGNGPDSRPSSSRSSGERAILEAPISAQLLMTTPEGAFQAKFVIPWETLCTHPTGVHIAFGQPTQEHEFLVTAELMPPPQPPSSRPTTPSGLSSMPVQYVPSPPMPTARSEGRVPLTHSPIRVISDIDDTVKLSGVITGARAVFHNVFVKDLKENVIRGMGEWYGDMWRQGARFHYVSNGPFELLPVINDFFQLANLPPGSIRLRSYGTRSLFNGLLSAPATRKRAGVADVLSSFPSSKFILIGDSGEQDLELYAAFARENYPQILCIFVRDVNSYDDGGSGIQDPTGALTTSGPDGQAYVASYMASRRKGSGPLSIVTPGSIRSGRWSPRSPGSMPSSPTQSLAMPSSSTPASRSHTGDYFSSRPIASEQPSPVAPMGASRLLSDTLTTEPANYGPPSPSISDSSSSSSGKTPMSQASMSESEKKRTSLQLRVWKARQEIPAAVVLRIFREPEECVEAMQVLSADNYKGHNSSTKDGVLVDLGD